MCVRGYWNTPKSIDLSKDQAVKWFKEQIQRIGLFNLTDTLYFPQRSGKLPDRDNISPMVFSFIKSTFCIFTMKVIIFGQHFRF